MDDSCGGGCSSGGCDSGFSGGGCDSDFSSRECVTDFSSVTVFPSTFGDTSSSFTSNEHTTATSTNKTRHNGSGGFGIVYLGPGRPIVDQTNRTKANRVQCQFRKGPIVCGVVTFVIFAVLVILIPVLLVK